VWSPPRSAHRGDLMSKKKDYLFNITPRWILYSGLPKQLNKEYGLCAWSIFHCLIQVDCRFNPNYCDTFDQSFEEIAELTGTTRQTVSKYIKLFEMDGLLSVKRGKFTGQKTTFELVNPIKTPKSPKDIHALKGGLLNRKGEQPNLRYAEQVKDVYPLEGSNTSKIHSEQVKDTEKQVKGFYYNKKKREDIKRRQQQEKEKKPDVVVSSLSNQKEEKPKPVVNDNNSTANLITKLKELGITEDKAVELLANHLYENVEKQVEWLPYRDGIKNPAGALIRAVEQNWLEPVTTRKGTPREWKESLKYKRLYTGYWESQKAMLKVAKEDLKKGAGPGRLKEWLDKLDPEYHEKLKVFVRGLNP